METTIPTMVTLKKAAEITKLPENCLRNLCNTGSIVFIKSGVKYFINLEFLLDFLNRGEQVKESYDKNTDWSDENV